ncbi:MAG: hypothetical protein ACPGVT_08855 [Maricaulaceae bacterium]
MPYTFDFFILNRSKYDPSDFLKWNIQVKLNSPNLHPEFKSICLNGNFFECVWDCYQSIPCHWPHQNMKTYNGLDRIGPGVIFSDGAKKLLDITKHLIALFSAAPKNFTLENGVFWVSDADQISIQDITSDQNSFDRDDIIGELEKLKQIAREIAQSDKTHFIGYHGL